MSNIKNAFKKKKAFITFLTAGDPDLDKTYEYILEMEKAGADLIEIGIPFSDPIAEGNVIQRANVRALKTGVNVDKIFLMVKKVRKKSEIPLVFLTYLNPVFNYGYDAFFSMCEKCKIDGIIIPDLPFEERNEIINYTDNYNIDLITLIAPTSEERVSLIAKSAKGFVYLVSSMGVTGVRQEIKTNLKEIADRIKMETNIPVCIGFGISTLEQAKELSKISDGIIVGSAIVKIIEQYKDKAHYELNKYVAKMCEFKSDYK